MFCAADGCDKEVIYDSGFCNSHYQRLNRYGQLERFNWGQTSHPFYFMWNDRKNDGLLCERWLDFKNFINDIGERPNVKCKLTKIRKDELYGPTNFKWLIQIIPNENETAEEFRIRKRESNADLYKEHGLKKNFNITLNQYNEILKFQNFVCCICKEKETTKHHISGKVKSLAVDHCHKTNKIRGLLCQRCNRTLGKIRDNVNLLDAMKVYLNDNGS